MEIAKIKDYLIEFQKSELPQIIERELRIGGGVTLINTILGPRRAGKTYFLYQLIKDLPKAKIIYLNFEDTRLASLTFKDFLDVVNLHIELFGSEPQYIFFDEPQNVEQWERGVRTLFDQRKYKIILTGSSSKLLSKEIATHLRGRSIKHLLLPYSFREFLRSQKVETPQLMTAKESSVIKNLLNKWLEWGGYPEVVKTPDAMEKMKILESYKELIIYKDIIERYRPKNSFLIKILIELMTTSFTKEFSINNWFNSLKSRNIAISKKTLYTYSSYIEDSLAIFLLEKWSPKLKEKRLSQKKAYLCDNGLAYKQKEISKMMENAVFLELKRLQNINPRLEIYYWKDYQLREVDFVVKRGRRIEELIQVTKAESKADLKEREISSLLAASPELKCRNLKVITWGYEALERQGGKKITFIPLWKWLLKD